MDDSEIERRLLAGDKHTEIAGEAGISVYQVRKVWKALVARLSDPAKVKALANGPMLNANRIVRWSSKAVRSRRTSKAVQMEMFDG